mgnify:FL=1
MAEFEEKLTSILGNQQAMDQIMALARSLSGEKEGEGEDAPREEGEPTKRETASSHSEGGNSPDLSQLLSGVDPGMLQMGMRLFQEYQGTDDRNAALLQALRPFLREERLAKLDKAVRIARMTRLIRVALGSMGEKGDEEGV